jgi:hypothetical protein
VENIGNPGDSTVAWGTLVANANDIIEYDSTAAEWFVSFNSINATAVQYVTNLTTNVQYRFTQDMWMKSWEGWIEQGDYSIVI